MTFSVRCSMRIKKIMILACLFSLIVGVGLFYPTRALALGLGEAGSLTLEGLIIGIIVLCVIFLVFMGLLLLARARELDYLQKNEDAEGVHFKPEDVMNMSAAEINQILSDRSAKTNGHTAE